MNHQAEKGDLKSLILCGCCEPLLFPNTAKEWPLTGKVSENLDKLTSKNQNIHFGKNNWLYEKNVKFETKREFINLSLNEYKNWLTDDKVTLNGMNKEDTWSYLSYIYVGQILDDKSDEKLFKEGIRWSDMGFHNLDGLDSTFWLGSQYSYTPLHSDSYGCNLVAQLEGRS